MQENWGIEVVCLPQEKRLHMRGRFFMMRRYCEKPNLKRKKP